MSDTSLISWRASAFIVKDATRRDRRASQGTPQTSGGLLATLGSPCKTLISLDYFLTSASCPSLKVRKTPLPVRPAPGAIERWRGAAAPSARGPRRPRGEHPHLCRKANHTMSRSRHTFIMSVTAAAFAVAGVGCSPSGSSPHQASQAQILDTAHGSTVPGFLFLAPFVDGDRSSSFGSVASNASPGVRIDLVRADGTMIPPNLATFAAASVPSFRNHDGSEHDERIRLHAATSACDDDVHLVDGGIYRAHVTSPRATRWMPAPRRPDRRAPRRTLLSAPARAWRRAGRSPRRPRSPPPRSPRRRRGSAPPDRRRCLAAASSTRPREA